MKKEDELRQKEKELMQKERELVQEEKEMCALRRKRLQQIHHNLFLLKRAKNPTQYF